MTAAPTVSFAVLTYNYGHFLRECVDSILGQTYRDFEILILDDCSTDHTPEVARSYADPRVRYVRHPKNLGFPANFASGIALSSGEFLWLISADDALHDDRALERALAVFSGRPDVGLVWSAAVRLGPPGDRIAHSDHGSAPLDFSAPELAELLVEENRICAPAGLARRASFACAQPAAGVLCFMLDWFCWFRIGLVSAARYLPEPLVRYRVHGQNMTHVHFGKKLTAQFREKAVLRLWMMAPDAEHPQIAPRARAALRRELKFLFLTWIFDRTDEVEIAAFLENLPVLAARIARDPPDFHRAFAGCLNEAMADYLRELLRERKLKSFLWGWRLRRRLRRMLDRNRRRGPGP